MTEAATKRRPDPSAPRLRMAIEPWASDLEAAAADADSLAQEDALRALEAIAKGEPVPEDAAVRIVERAREGQ